MYTLRACRRFAYRGKLADMMMPVARVWHVWIVVWRRHGRLRYMWNVPIVWRWGTW